MFVNSPYLYDLTSRPPLFLTAFDRGVWHLVDGVDGAALQVGDHRVGVGVVDQAHRLDVRRRAPVARVGLEHGRALLRVLGDLEGSAGYQRQVVLGPEGLQVLAVAAHVLAPDVLGQDVQRRDVRQHQVRVDRRVVVEDHLVGAVGGYVADVGDGAGHVGGRVRLVLDDRVRRPGHVGRGQRLAVRPLAAGVQRVGIGLEVRAMRPGRGVAALVGGQVGRQLHQLGVHLEVGRNGLGLDVVERVQRVDVVGRADREHATLLNSSAASGRAAAASAAGGQKHGGQRGRSDQPA